MNLRDLWLRLRSLLFGRRVEHELQEELDFHLDMQARKKRSQGVPEEAARRQARLKFGNVATVAEECRDQRGIQLIDSLGRDIRYAGRQLRRTPIFTAVALLSLALGIGANTALFTVFDTLYLRKLPVPQPDDLVSFRWRALGESNPLVPGGVFGSLITSSDNSGREYQASTSFPLRTFETFRQSASTPAEVFGFARFAASAEIRGWPRDVTAQLVSGNYFSGLGVRTIAGRLLELKDDEATAEPAAVISYFAWQTLFGGEQSAIGETIRINGTTATVVGILPRDFYIAGGTAPDFSLPAAFASSVSQGALARPEIWWIRLMARKQPAATIKQVEASLQGVFQGTLETASFPQVSPEQVPRLEAVSASRGFVDVVSGGQQEDLLLTVWVVVTVLLLIVCLNLANLLTARAISREYEIGMRLALGASRLRLIRQLVTESVVVALLGGVAGILLSVWGEDLLRAYFRTQIPMDINWRVLAFNVAVACITGLLFGLVPALRATRMTVNNSMKGNARVAAVQPRPILNRSLVVIQVAMAVVLLIGAGLLVQSAGNWKRLDLGFNPDEIVVFQAPPAEKRAAGLYGRLADRIREAPGVRGVSTAGCFPPDSCSSSLSTSDRDDPVRVDARRLIVPPRFFETMGISLVAGRAFASTDLAVGTAVAIVDTELARALYPASNPIGQHIHFGEGERRAEFEIVGVVESAVFDIDRSRIRPNYYTPQTEAGLNSGTSFVIRIAGSPQNVIPEIRQAVAEVDSNFPIFGLTTLQQIVEQTLSRQRQMSATWILFGSSALLLTAIGLYGLMSYIVTRRLNEIGIRIALGATSESVLLLVMRQIFLLVAGGIATGFVLSLILTQVLRAYVFGVHVVEVWTLLAVAGIVTVVTAVASYLPARKGTRIDPVAALRCD